MTDAQKNTLETATRLLIAQFRVLMKVQEELPESKMKAIVIRQCRRLDKTILEMVEALKD